MKRLTLLSALFCICLFSYSTNAQTQTKKNLHAEENYRKADLKLSELSQKLLKKYTHDSVFLAHFIESQHGWIRFRDAEVRMKYPPSGDGNIYGDKQPALMYSYTEKLINERIKSLNELLYTRNRSRYHH